MEKEVKQLFNERILLDGASKFDVNIENLSYIGAWQNFIYEYRKNGTSYILKFTPSSHRSENSVKGELDWILHLANHGISVSSPIQSAGGELTAVIDAREVYFTVASFVKAEGQKIGYPECLNDNKLYEKLGQIMGRMHSLSKTYVPKDESIRRHDWTQNYYLQNMGKYVTSNQALVHENCRILIKKIKDSLSKDNHSYGLIHGDMGVGNFVVYEKGITLFDFDEAQYSWFAEDIAIPLYYLVYVYGGEEGKENRESQAKRFMEHFLNGYDQENSLDRHWLKQIPLFLQLREMIVYTGMYRSSDLTKLNQWGVDFLSESKKRIENGIPIVNVWQ